MVNGTFNTGRLYTDIGQPIDWTFDGTIVKFWDRARGINGTFQISPRWNPKTFEDHAEKIIMEHYDGGRYENFI